MTDGPLDLMSTRHVLISVLALQTAAHSSVLAVQNDVTSLSLIQHYVTQACALTTLCELRLQPALTVGSTTHRQLQSELPHLKASNFTGYNAVTQRNYGNSLWHAFPVP